MQRHLLACGLLLALPSFPIAPLLAQFPAPLPSQLPVGSPSQLATSPRTLPPSALSQQTTIPQPGVTLPPQAQMVPTTPEVRLPRPEGLQPFETRNLTVRRMTNSWQVWMNGKLFRDCGNSMDNANEVVRVLRELNPGQWAVIGDDFPIVEYGVSPQETGRLEPPKIGGLPKVTLPIDLRTARVEQIRGVWCLRDDLRILLNFGTNKLDAYQAIGVIRKYGFNRIGQVGRPEPVLSYFYVSPETESNTQVPNAGALASIALQAQERSMARTGIEVPGLGYVGEKLTIDPKKIEIRRDRGDYVLAYGNDILSRFSGSDWAARDALRMLQEMRVNEFCRFGTQGVVFFLQNGVPPQRVPFFAQGARFDPKSLTIMQQGGLWWVMENSSKTLVPAASREEAEQWIKIIRAFGFDQMGQVGTSSRSSLRFLSKVH